MLLEKLGYRVLMARNGEEALEVCQCQPQGVNVLITDVVMPRMSGQELVQQLAPPLPVHEGPVHVRIYRHGRYFSRDARTGDAILAKAVLLRRPRQENGIVALMAWNDWSKRSPGGKIAENVTGIGFALHDPETGSIARGDFP
jgi:hypothetical protein